MLKRLRVGQPTLTFVGQHPLEAWVTLDDGLWDDDPKTVFIADQQKRLE
jgi:hypothetical protein